MKTEEEGANKEEAVKGRKRKKSVRADTSDICGAPTVEVDPITATIEAVLANTSTLNTSAEKPKKVKRVKKQHQEGNVVKTPKQDPEKTADDADDNDDDSSTAGNEEEFSERGWGHITSCRFVET